MRHTSLVTAICGVFLLLVVDAASADACRSSYASKSATTALERVLEFTPYTGSMFRIRASRHVSNAIATFCNDERYIIVNEKFLEGLGYDTLRWTWPKLYVLAHEIGHHVAGHVGDLRTHKRELEADRYAGHLLARMGATLDQALAAPESLPKPSTTTHPSREDRVAAARVGYQEATRNIRFVLIGDMPDMQRYWNRGMSISAIGYGPTIPEKMPQIHVALSRDNGSIQRCKIHSQNVPRDWIHENWDAGYLIQSLTHSRGGWLAIMESRDGYSVTSQRWFASREFPEGEIETEWDDNHMITSLSHGGSRWAMVTTEARRGWTQRWFKNYTSDRMKMKTKEYWDKGYHITSLDWSSDSKFTFVMTRVEGESRRAEMYRIRSYFPEEVISDYLRRGYHVAHLVHAFDGWAVVMTTRPLGLDR